MNLTGKNLVKSKTEKVTRNNGNEKKSLPSRYILLVLSGIIVLTIIIYSQIPKNNFLNWDDPSYVYENEDITNFSIQNVRQWFTNDYVSCYLPLTMVSYAVDYKIGKLNPKVYTITNLFIHILNGLLVFWLVMLLLLYAPNNGPHEYIQGKYLYLPALLTSLLFAIHPINVESVAWVAERKNLLSAFFFLFSIIFYTKFVIRKKTQFYFLSTLLFLFALLSKGTAVTLSLCILGIDYLFQRKLFSRQVLIEKIPFFALSVIFGLITIYFQGDENIGINHSVINQLAFAAFGFVGYLQKLLFPVNLLAFYSYPQTPAIIHWFSLLISVSIIYLLFHFRKRLSGLILFALLFYAANIIFLIQLIPVGKAIMADRYIYLSSIAFFLIFAVLILNAGSKIKLLYLLIPVCLVYYSFQTYERVKVWNNSLVFWDEIIEKDQSIPVSWLNRGDAKKELNDLEGAIADYNNAILLNPGYYEAYYNRGIIKSQLTDFKSALQDFDKTIEINPYYYHAYCNRGNVRKALNDYKGAMDDYQTALTNNSDVLEVNFNIGMLNGRQNNFEEAIIYFSRAIDLNPAYSDAYCYRGKAKLELTDTIGAIADYNAAISINPGYSDAHFFKAMAYYKLGDFPEALTSFSKTIESDSTYTLAYYNRSIILKNSKDFKAAIADLTKVIYYDPEFLNAWIVRAKLKVFISDYNGAIADCDNALKIDNSQVIATNIKAIADYKLGKYSDSVKESTHALKTDPQSGMTYYIRGRSYLKMNSEKSGNEDLKKARNLSFLASENEMTRDL